MSLEYMSEIHYPWEKIRMLFKTTASIKNNKSKIMEQKVIKKQLDFFSSAKRFNFNSIFKILLNSWIPISSQRIHKCSNSRYIVIKNAFLSI